MQDHAPQENPPNKTELTESAGTFDLYHDVEKQLIAQGMHPVFFPLRDALVVEIGTEITCCITKDDEGPCLPRDVIESFSPDVCCLIFNRKGRLVSFSAVEDDSLMLPRGIEEGTVETIPDRCLRFQKAMNPGSLENLSLPELESVFGYPARPE